MLTPGAVRGTKPGMDPLTTPQNVNILPFGTSNAMNPNPDFEEKIYGKP
jgi:hypothetical protein